MSKFRSKLKKKEGVKRWKKGGASSSNPETSKHRIKAKSRFFQANLSLAPPADDRSDQNSKLTLEAVLKHEAIQSYSGGGGSSGKGKVPTVNDIAASMKSFSMKDGEDETMSESQQGTFKTFQTFASNYSACTNMSFKKLLNSFRADSQVQKDMLAILAALTEVIKENGGTQSSTEYFLALMETIEAAKEANDVEAAVSLLAMGIKSVPEGVLRRKFSDSAQILLALLERYTATENQAVTRNLIGCLSVLLRAQEYGQWKVSSTLKFFDAILAFTTHTKPKLRKAAQHAVVAVIHGSCFMLPPKVEGDGEFANAQPYTADERKPLIKHHPAGGRVARFCIGQFKPENVANNQTVILHVLGLLHNALPGFNRDDIKLVAENLLSIMTATNVLIRTNCFQTFHSLFSSRTENLSPVLAGKLLTALYDYRPDRSDSRQIIAWLTVLKEGHLFLAKHDLALCSAALPKFVQVCTQDFWSSDRLDVVSAASNALKDVLYECVQPCCTDEEVERHRAALEKVLKYIIDVLCSAPFGHASSHVLIILAIIFDIAGRHFGATLAPALTTLGTRYDSHSSNRIQIEHAVLQAVGSIDTELVLQCIPLVTGDGKIDLDRTWMLPLLREGLQRSSLALFNDVILKLAYQCYMLWQKFKETDNKNQAHIFELLCCQLWGLFPGFCRNPKDVASFRMIAKTLGTVLNENPDLRAPILDGLKELITHLETDADRDEVGRFAKNFLPRLFNIYTTKPKGSYENETRQTAFETIQAYLSITPKPVLDEMFNVALQQLQEKAPGTFIYDMLFDIVEQLALYQSQEKLDEIYQKYISVILKRDKSQDTVAKENANIRRQMKKAFKLLQEILASENKGCVAFVETKMGNIEKLLLGTMRHSYDGIQAPRLTCLKLVLDRQASAQLNCKLITRTISEAVATYHVEAIKKENIAVELLEKIGQKFDDKGKINQFIELVIAGFAGDTQLICNTIWVLRDILQQFTGTLSIDSLKFMLEQVLTFLVGNSRTEVEAALNFVLLYTKILPIPLVTNYLSLIVKALSMMVPDTKRHNRLMMGYIWKKLCKRFGALEIIQLVPGNDEVTHKRLKKIRKDLARAKRNKELQKGKGGKDNDDDDDDDDDEDQEGDFASHLQKKSLTIEDILEDSDSDSDSGVENEKKTRQKKKGTETFIKESEDNIVDLADLDAIGMITTNAPMDEDQSRAGPSKERKDPNRGFKTAADGRLLIEDIEDHSDSDEDQDEAIGYADKAKKRVYDRDSGESDEDEQEDIEPNGDDDGPSSRKRKAIDALSARSGMSGTSARYVAGGKGIHRPVAASVKSGYSGKTARSQRTAKSNVSTGAEYRSKKASGDMLKKGKHEPFAYVPLSRNSLNRRKRSKNAGQFKNIVKSARKGAAAGSKNRLMKAGSKRK